MMFANPFHQASVFMMILYLVADVVLGVLALIVIRILIRLIQMRSL